MIPDPLSRLATYANYLIYSRTPSTDNSFTKQSKRTFQRQIHRPVDHYSDCSPSPPLSPHPLTERGLQQARVPLAVAYRVQVGGVDQPPEVILVVAAVQPQSQPRPLHADDGRDARRRQVTRVGRLQLLTDAEPVDGRHRRLHTRSDTSNLRRTVIHMKAAQKFSCHFVGTLLEQNLNEKKKMNKKKMNKKKINKKKITKK